MSIIVVVFLLFVFPQMLMIKTFSMRRNESKHEPLAVSVRRDLHPLPVSGFGIPWKLI